MIARLFQFFLIALVAWVAGFAVAALAVQDRMVSVENCMRYTQALESEFGAVGW